MRALAFLSNRRGVGQTSFLYHLAWMYSDLGLRVLAADLDPQADLSGMLLDEDRLEELWIGRTHVPTIYEAIKPLLDGTGDVAEPGVERISDNLSLLVGDLALAGAEGELSRQWSNCLDRDARAFLVVSGLWRAVVLAAEQCAAHLVLIDLGPNLGAVNRAALVGGQHVVISVAPDLYSVQALMTLGPTLRRWRDGWGDRLFRNPVVGLRLPDAAMAHSSYVVIQRPARLKRPVRACENHRARVPGVYRRAVLGNASEGGVRIEEDPHCLGLLRNYRSLMPLAQEARKPMFYLKPADGVIGGQGDAVQECFRELRELARRIAEKTGAELPYEDHD